MKATAAVGKRVIDLALLGGLCFALAGPAYAGSGFGGGMHGGFHGGFHGGRGHGGRFQNAGGLRFRVCNGNGACISGFTVGSVIPGLGYGNAYPYPEDAAPLDIPSPAPPPSAQTEMAPALPREACSPGGCYRLQGDGMTVAFNWVWVPAPPPPPPPPATIRYPNGRYEQHGDGISTPSRWVWIPDAPAASLPVMPAAPLTSSAPRPVAPVPSQLGDLYRWVDDQGTVHWTQGLDAVPEHYRPPLSRGTSG